MTYSIVARDAETGALGVAVQSHWFSVGSIVPWAEAGVGAIATQAFADPAYGPRLLGLLGSGMSAPDAVRGLVSVDTAASRRQLGAIDASGAISAHTGADCISEFGHVVGDAFSCQANMMARPGVPEAMASAFAGAGGDFVSRLLSALDAAEAAGGDVRGRQSAALLIVHGERRPHAAAGRVVDLRVEDHPAPLDELRRLTVVHRAYVLMNEGDEQMASGDMEAAAASYELAQAAVPDNAEFTFWRAVTAATSGRIDDARRLMAPLDARWREVLRRLPDAGLADAHVVDQLLPEDKA